jgi:hypothetical protein
MSYHHLTSGGVYGVVAQDGTLTKNGTRNVDLTTEDDDSTASGVPAEICCVHMLVQVDTAGIFKFHDNTQAIGDVFVGYGGPNVCGEEADVDYFIAAITKSDGSIDIAVPNTATDPNVKITVLGYSDVTWHAAEEQMSESFTMECFGTRDDDETYTDQQITDADSVSVGATWCKALVDMQTSSIIDCPLDPEYSFDVVFEDPRVAFADLNAYTPQATEDINTDAVNRGAGYCMNIADLDMTDICTFCTDANGQVTLRAIGDIYEY